MLRFLNLFNLNCGINLLSVPYAIRSSIIWISTATSSWRCGREHQVAKCNLKDKCKQCERRHLGILHEVNTSQHTIATGKPQVPEPSMCLVSSVSESLIIDRINSSWVVSSSKTAQKYLRSTQYWSTGQSAQYTYMILLFTKCFRESLKHSTQSGMKSAQSMDPLYPSQ